MNFAHTDSHSDSSPSSDSSSPSFVPKVFDNTNAIYQSGCAVSTLSGTGKEGHHDGTKSEAQFNSPAAIAADKHGDLYVADFWGHQLRKINTADGSVCTVAGTGKRGSKDGPACEAEFICPYGVAVGTNGNILVTEFYGNSLRAFSSATNTVTTIAGVEACLSYPYGVAVSADGNIFVCDSNHHRIVKIPAGEGAMEIVAGDGQNGHLDGEAHKARFKEPDGIAVSCSGDMYVADSGNNCIRKIHAHTGMVSTVAGSGKAGWRDGDATAAQLNSPFNVAVAADGCVYIADGDNHCIRKLDPVDGRVVTVAGTDEKGFRNGEGNLAQFNKPRGLTFGRNGVLYVADMYNNRIRAITIPAEAPQRDPDAFVMVSSRELADLQKELANLKMEKKEHEEAQLCKICLDRPRQYAFLPCGHLACCAECANGVARCPLCARSIRTFHRVYEA